MEPSDEEKATSWAKDYVKYEIENEYGRESSGLQRGEIKFSNVQVVSVENGYFNSTLRESSFLDYVWVNGTMFKITGSASWHESLLYYGETIMESDERITFAVYILKTEETVYSHHPDRVEGFPFMWYSIEIEKY